MSYKKRLKPMDTAEGIGGAASDPPYGRPVGDRPPKTCYAFSAGMCDDLCELVLQWLPIDDKIRYTGVCRQFQRCLRRLWPQQRCLRVDADCADDRHNWPTLLRPSDDTSGSDATVDRRQAIHTVRIAPFAKVLQTFPQISDICFGKQHIDNDSDVLNAITRCCLRLRTIRFDLSDCSATAIQAFGLKFGRHLRHVEFLYSTDMFAARLLIGLCPNLASVTNVYFENLFAVDRTLLVKNVTKLTVYGVEDMDLLDTFITECPKLTHLDIRLYMKTTLSTNQVLRKVSQLKELEVLFVYCGHYDTLGQCLAKSLAMIAESCRSLKTFAFEFETSDSFNTKNCFEGFREFQSLRRLRFDITHFSDKTYPNDKLSNECLRKCRHLTHLELNSHQINDEFFVDIDRLFPRLRHLLIRTKDEITDKALAYISRVQSLQTLVISCFGEPEFKTLKSITDSGLIRVIDECRHLRQIHCWNRVNITERTIEALVAKAVANPKTFFRFSFLGIGDRLDLESALKSTPHSMANVVINEKPFINRLLHF